MQLLYRLYICFSYQKVYFQIQKYSNYLMEAASHAFCVSAVTLCIYCFDQIHVHQTDNISKHRTIDDIRMNFLCQLDKIWPCFGFGDWLTRENCKRPDLSLVIDLACRMLHIKFLILIDVALLIACSNCTVIYARVTYRAELHTCTIF